MGNNTSNNSIEISNFNSLTKSLSYIFENKGDRRFRINAQFHSDKTIICPMCGSHSITIYRKGYDYNKGFWYKMFNLKGGAYIAGMESNSAMCHCDNCGHKWDSGYDYRIVKKHKK